MGGRHAAERRPDVRRLPPSRVARPDRPGRRRPASPADDRHTQRPPSPVLARRPLARVHLGSAAAGRAGTGAAQGGQGSRGQGPGPCAAARRAGRSAPADRPAARRGGLRMVARQPAAGGRIDVPRRDPRRGRASARDGTQAAARRAARIGLSLHRPSQLHAQRPGLPVRPRPPPLAGRRRDGRRDSPDRRARVGHGAGVVAGRHAHRVRVRAPSRPRPDAAAGHPRGRCPIRARSTPSRSDRDRCSARRRGFPTGRPSRRSATSSRGAAEAGTTSGCSRPMARRRTRTVVATSRVDTT